MILTAHQPVYLPWLGLFNKIAQADDFVSFNQVQYQPKSYNSRNKIKLNGKAHYLTVPVFRKNFLNKTISEIEINNTTRWNVKHLGTIKQAYNKTPYYSRYIDFFEDTYNQEWNMLTELNEYMLLWFLDVLGIKVNYHNAKDWNFQGNKSELVLDMCNQLGAKDYIFGSQGMGYADVSSFKKCNVNVSFQDYSHPIYPQFGNEFIPYLSIIDLLFNCGDDSLSYIMGRSI
jgi:hypothetical protein